MSDNGRYLLIMQGNGITFCILSLERVDCKMTKKFARRAVVSTGHSTIPNPVVVVIRRQGNRQRGASANTDKVVHDVSSYVSRCVTI